MPYVETSPFLNSKPPEKTSEGFTSESLFFHIEREINQGRIRGIDYWRKEYKKAYKRKGISDETARITYQGMHGSNVFELRNEEKQADLDFLKERLAGLTKEDASATAYRLYRLALFCLEKPKPGAERAMELWGYALIQMAYERYQDPLYARAQIDERLFKAQERRKKKRQKQRARLKEKGGARTLLHAFNAPELDREFSTPHYIQKVEHWADVLEEVSKGRKIDFGEFQKRHETYATSAKKAMDNRGRYDKPRKRYDYLFFEDLLRSEMDAFNAYTWGLTALYTPTQDSTEKDRLEILGLKLLEKSHELSVKEREADGKNPTAFYPWAIKEEYLVRMTRPNVQSKRKVRGRDFGNTMARTLAREKGGLLKNLPSTNLPIPEPSSPLDEIPH